jgi:hypothetical protein
MSDATFSPLYSNCTNYGSDVIWTRAFIYMTFCGPSAVRNVIDQTVPELQQASLNALYIRTETRVLALRLTSCMRNLDRISVFDFVAAT